MTNTDAVPRGPRWGRYRAVGRHYLHLLGQTPGRLADSLANGLPPGLSTRMIRGLERAGRPTEVSLGDGSPTESTCLVDTWQVAPPAFVEVPPVDGLPSDGHYWPATRVHHLRDVTVDTDSGLVFAGSSVIAQSGYGFRSAADGAFLSGAFTRRQRFEAGESREPVAPMGAVWNYYHFLVEDLPRLLHIRKVEPNAAALFRTGVPPFVKDSLALLGIPLKELPRTILHSQSTWLCDPAPFCWPRPADLGAVWESTAAIRNLNDPTAALYVSRAGSSRPMVEESQLEDLVRSRGGLVLRPEALPWAEQVQRFSTATLVVGPHGAGLANSVFMRPGSTLVEITSGSWWNPCFRNIAIARGLHYRLIRVRARGDAPHGHARDALEPVSSLL